MRDRLNTRRLLAKIDRDEDPYVIFDRIRQLLYDMEDRQERTDERLHALEREKSKFITDSGLHRTLVEVRDTGLATAVRTWRGKLIGWVLVAGIGSGFTLLMSQCHGTIR